MYRVKLPVKLDGERYGIRFLDGVGKTEDYTLAVRLRGKGFEVTEENEQDSDVYKEIESDAYSENTARDQKQREALSVNDPGQQEAGEEAGDIVEASQDEIPDELPNAEDVQDGDVEVAENIQPEYAKMSDEELVALAIERGINIEGMSRRKILYALKK